MAVYRCSQCDLNMEYENGLTGPDAFCPICGDALELDQQGLIEPAARKTSEEDQTAEDPNRAKTIGIIGFGMPAVALFIAVVFGFIRRRITWGMDAVPGTPAHYMTDGPAWLTLAGTEAVLLGCSGVFLALALHLDGYWRVVTGQIQFKYWGTLSGAIALGFLVAAFAVKGMAQ